MSSENRAVSELKQQANSLKLAITLASKHSYNFDSYEPAMHLPSLQQCIESISHAYGFKSFNGFLQTQSLDNVFSSKLLVQSIQSQLKEVNNLDVIGVNFATGWIAVDLDEQVAQKASILMQYLESLPFTQDLIPPKMIYTDMIDISRHVSKPRGNETHLRFAEYVLSHIVDGIGDGTVLKSEMAENTLYFLPLSKIYKHKITGDLNQARSIIKYIVDDINLSGVLSAHEGGLEFIDHHNSVINIVVESKLAKELEQFSKINAVMDELLSKFHTLLEIYPKPVIDFKKVSKLKGYDHVKYSTYKYFMVKILLDLINEDHDEERSPDLEEYLKALSSNYDGKSNIKLAVFRKWFESNAREEAKAYKTLASISPHSHLVNEAITKFDDCFARFIYPFFSKERASMAEFKAIAKMSGNVKKESIPLLVQTESLGMMKNQLDAELLRVQLSVLKHRVGTEY